MTYLLVAALFAVVLLWRPGGRGLWRVAYARVASGFGSVAALIVGAILAVRGDWPAAIASIILGTYIGAYSSPQASWPAAAPLESETMSLDEARAVLGIEPGADSLEIRRAYARVMRRAHPDHGGTSGLAARVNAARERLGRP